MRNRFMLAPLTNLQSHEDGTMSAEELQWLRLRAEGGFGLTMTCASHVQAVGQGFPGQLGSWSDAHLAGLTDLAEALNELALEASALPPRVRAAHARTSRTMWAGSPSRFASRSSRSMPSVTRSPKTRTSSQVASSSRQSARACSRPLASSTSCGR